MLKTICILPEGEVYGHMAIMEEGRAVFRAHCGDPALDWRLVRVVADALRHQGDTVQPADDFAAALGRLGYVLNGNEVAKVSSAPAIIPFGI